MLVTLMQSNPYWLRAEISGGIYKGHPDATTGSFGVSIILVAPKSLPNPAAYSVAKALLENADEFIAANNLAREWCENNALRGIKGMIPFHPGAEAYLKEVGLLNRLKSSR